MEINWKSSRYFNEMPIEFHGKLNSDSNFNEIATGFPINFHFLLNSNWILNDFPFGFPIDFHLYLIEIM